MPQFPNYYALENGEIFDKKHNKICKKYINKDGYYIVSVGVDIHKKVMQVHQLIAMAYLNHVPCGYKTIVDHIDNNKQNNELSNLQLVSARHNISKSAMCKNKSSKYTGVSWSKRNNVWISAIKIKGKSKYIGSFKNEEDAGKAYQNKLKELGL